MGNPQITPNERFAYRHYKTWPDEERWELIDGHAWAMSPAPRRRHQEISGKLSRKIGNFIEGKPYIAYTAPFDVLLPEGGEADDDVDTVVQPDLVVYCDKSRLTDAGARGAPDIAIEILSPSTSRKDQKEKFDRYERAGVREYWIVDPAAWSVWVYRLAASGRFDEGELKERLGDVSPIASSALQGFVVDPVELFADLD